MENKEEDNKILYLLGFGVAISTLLLNIVQIRSYIKNKEKENKSGNDNQL